MGSLFVTSIDDEDQPLVGPRSGLGAGSGAAAFTSPLSIAGLKLWLKADAGTNQTTGGSAAVADGDPVGEWLDQSGNGKHMLQATSTRRGTLKLGQNSRMVVRGDGVDDIIRAATPASVLTDNFTGFIASRQLTGTGTTMYFSNGNNNNGHGYGPVSGKRNVWANAVNLMDDGAYTLNTFEIVMWKRASGTMTLRVNTGAQSITNSTSSVNTPSGDLAVLSRGDGLAANAEVGEILLYDAAVSDADRDLIEAYLNTRWAAF